MSRNSFEFERNYLDVKVRAMPKLELHVHLEGAIGAETVWDLAQKNDVRLPANDLNEWKSFYAFRDFDHFIEIYELACRCIRTPDDYTFLVERFLEEQARQNVLYTECFISTSAHLGKIGQHDLLDALFEGRRRGEEMYGGKVKFIPDIARHLPETQRAVLEFALEGLERGLVVAIGIGGKEVGFPPELFERIYREAREAGLRLHARAGETEGPSSVQGAVQRLHAERIGHGFRSLEDSNLVGELREKQIPFEVCPVSNYRTGVVKRGIPHPIRAMLDAGLFCTLNSDDPAMFDTSLHREYMLLIEQRFSWNEIWTLNENAIEAAFLSEEEKEHYQGSFKDFADWAGV
jgi:adenosine deaminase